MTSIFSPKKPSNRCRSVYYIVGGVLNCILPGISSSIVGVIVDDGSMVLSGCLQLASLFIIIGYLWAVVYGIKMIYAGYKFTVQSYSNDSAMEEGKTHYIISRGKAERKKRRETVQAHETETYMRGEVDGRYGIYYPTRNYQDYQNVDNVGVLWYNIAPADYRPRNDPSAFIEKERVAKVSASHDGNLMTTVQRGSREMSVYDKMYGSRQYSNLYPKNIAHSDNESYTYPDISRPVLSLKHPEIENELSVSEYQDIKEVGEKVSEEMENDQTILELRFCCLAVKKTRPRKKNISENTLCKKHMDFKHKAIQRPAIHDINRPISRFHNQNYKCAWIKDRQKSHSVSNDRPYISVAI